MRFDPQLGITDLRDDSAGRRRWGRLDLEAVISDHGPVLDLSGGGMRIMSKRSLKGRIATRIWGLGSCVPVTGRVIRCRRLGFRRYEVGIAFEDSSPDHVRQLTALALNNRLRRAM